VAPKEVREERKEEDADDQHYVQRSKIKSPDSTGANQGKRKELNPRGKRATMVGTDRRNDSKPTRVTLCLKGEEKKFATGKEKKRKERRSANKRDQSLVARLAQKKVTSLEQKKVPEVAA